MTLIKILNFIISHSLSLKWRLFYLICLFYGIALRKRKVGENVLLKKFSMLMQNTLLIESHIMLHNNLVECDSPYIVKCMNLLHHKLDKN